MCRASDAIGGKRICMANDFQDREFLRGLGREAVQTKNNKAAPPSTRSRSSGAPRQWSMVRSLKRPDTGKPNLVDWKQAKVIHLTTLVLFQAAWGQPTN
jgi:hypothetical protein